MDEAAKFVVAGQGIGVDQDGPGVDLAGDLLRVPDDLDINTGADLLERIVPDDMRAAFRDKLKGSLSGFIGSLLLRDYGVLVAFTEYNRNVIRLEPPLICSRDDVDTFVDALDDLLSRGIVAIVKDFVKSQMG